MSKVKVAVRVRPMNKRGKHIHDDHGGRVGQNDRESVQSTSWVLWTLLHPLYPQSVWLLLIASPLPLLVVSIQPLLRGALC